ncbi:MAG: hypothetical protein ACFE9R_05300 [Candidatus Hermodarchaeota archaeon]
MITYRAQILKIDFQKSQERQISHISKYVSKEKKELMKQKLDEVSQIIMEAEQEIERTVSRKLKSVKAQMEESLEEENVIEEAGKDYNVYIAGLKSAIPSSEKELIQDRENLEEAVKKLESYDESYYEAETEEVTVGSGIFYEKMCRKFNTIIREHNLDEFPMIPIQRLKFYAYSEIKGLKEDDFLPIVRLMEVSRFITGLIEVDSNFYILVFLEELPQFSNAEKVVLSLSYNEDNLTIQQLLELTGWDYIYANKILDKLKKKELVVLEKENIIVKGFETPQERKEWNAIIDNYISKEKEKEELKIKRQIELKNKLKTSGEKEKKVKLVEVTESTISESNIAELEGDDSPKKTFKGRPKVKELPQTKKKIKRTREENLKIPLDFNTIEKEDLDLSERISQKVLDFHEKYSVVNGGFCQYEKLLEFINKEMEHVNEGTLKEVLVNLTNLKLISKSLKIGKATFYLFKEIDISSKEKSFIKYALNKKPLKKLEFKRGLKWKEEDVLNIMKSLQENNILRIESDKIIIPGIIQKK